MPAGVMTSVVGRSCSKAFFNEIRLLLDDVDVVDVVELWDARREVALAFSAWRILA